MSSFLDDAEPAGLTILLVDDHAIFRQGLRRVLSVAFPDTVITEVATGHECLNAIRRQNFDLVFLDLNLPDKSGLEVLQEAKAYGLTAPVIILSMYSEKQFGVRALKAQGASYLRKDCSTEEVVQCVHIVLKENKYIPPNLGAQLAQVLEHPELACLHSTLSDREFEVLRLLSFGHTPKEVANHLALSVKTVSSHRARLLQKLELRTTGELIRYAITNRLFDE